MTELDDVADIKKLKDRADGLERWLKENAPEIFTEQLHTDQGTRERLYWHYGYMVALRDVLRFMTGESILHTPDTELPRSAA